MIEIREVRLSNKERKAGASKGDSADEMRRVWKNSFRRGSKVRVGVNSIDDEAVFSRVFWDGKEPVYNFWLSRKGAHMDGLHSEDKTDIFGSRTKDSRRSGRDDGIGGKKLGGWRRVICRPGRGKGIKNGDRMECRRKSHAMSNDWNSTLSKR